MNQAIDVCYVCPLDKENNVMLLPTHPCTGQFDL